MLSVQVEYKGYIYQKGLSLNNVFLHGYELLNVEYTPGMKIMTSGFISVQKAYENKVGFEELQFSNGFCVYSPVGKEH